jgi:hypothetical protein
MRHQLSDVAPHEILLGGIEIPIDVAKGRQIEDDGPHLLFGFRTIRAEREHPATIPKGRAGMNPQRPRQRERVLCRLFGDLTLLFSRA